MSKLEVKLMDHSDIPFVLDYWMNASPDYLESMGADFRKMPSRENFEKMLLVQLETAIEEKNGLATIWMLDGKRVGHCNVNQLQYGEQANMHLHIWTPSLRQKGSGQKFLKQSISLFFETLKLKTLYCEPAASNPAPNRTLPKVGFSFVKKYRCIPGAINFEQEVNRWVLKKSLAI